MSSLWEWDGLHITSRDLRSRQSWYNGAPSVGASLVTEKELNVAAGLYRSQEVYDHIKHVICPDLVALFKNYVVTFHKALQAREYRFGYTNSVMQLPRSLVSDKLRDLGIGDEYLHARLMEGGWIAQIEFMLAEEGHAHTYPSILEEMEQIAQG